MRIAHFIQRYPPALGGSESYFARLSRYLVDQGDYVTVFTSSARCLEAFWSLKGECLPAGESRVDGVLVRRYGLLRWPGRRYVLGPLQLVPWRPWQCLTMPCNPISLQMWRDCGRTDTTFDIVHASAFPYAWPIMCGLRVARRLRAPFFLTPFLHLGDPADPHDPVRRAYTAPQLTWLLRQADGIFVQTPSERDQVFRLGVDAKRVHLQGLGVDPAECTGGARAKTRRAWGIADDEIAVGHLANQSREKGTIDLLQAADKVWQRGMKIKLILAGPEMPNFRHYWQGVADRPEMISNVVRLGVLDDAGKKDFFAGLDVFALPSRSDSFGLVLLEAWANAVPNLAYRAGGIADLIRHGDDGLLVSCGDIAGLAEGLMELANDPARRQRLGESGQARVGRDFHWADKLALVSNRYRETKKTSV